MQIILDIALAFDSEVRNFLKVGIRNQHLLVQRHFRS